MRLRALIVILVLGSATPTSGADFTLDDFDDGDRVSRSGASWVGLADDLMAQRSRVRLAIVGAGSGRKALRVEGELTDRFAGAWVALEEHAQAVDLRSFNGVRLRVRGPGELSVGLRGGAIPFVNFIAPVKAVGEWSEVEVPFSAFRPVGPNAEGAVFDLSAMRWLGVGASSSTKGAFRFDVDAVALRAAAADGGAALPVTGGPAMEARVAPSKPPKGSEGWPILAEDPRGDGLHPALPDARRVRGWRDPSTGTCWLRVELSAALQDDWVGMNLVLDLDGDAANGSEWWGVNKSLRFDRLLTAWIFDVGSRYQGVLGIADAADVARSDMMNPTLGTPELAVDFQAGAILAGVPRAALGKSASAPRAVVAVGSAFMHNDDVPDAGGFALPR
jgi:hypothetical protein